MPLASVGGRPKRVRRDPIGSIGPGKSFNHFPQIMRRFPEAISDIVYDTTLDLAIDADDHAPVQGQARGRPPGYWNGRKDIAPGTIKRSLKVRFGRRRGTDIVISGRVDFKAKDPTAKEPNHSFAKAVEVGSVRTNRSIGRGAGHYAVPAEPFVVPAIVRQRPKFISRLRNLESRL